MLYYAYQVARAADRLLNALLGGEGDSTFSAWSYYMLVQGSRWGRWRVAIVDAMPFNYAGHCKDAYDWHVKHDLLTIDLPEDA